MELLQMALAIGLFAVGLLLLVMIRLAQSGKTLGLASPGWARWSAGLLVVAIVGAACQPVTTDVAPATTDAATSAATPGLQLPLLAAPAIKGLAQQATAGDQRLNRPRR
jgi:hypothetical protein